MRRTVTVYFTAAVVAWVLSFFVTPGSLHALPARVLLATGLLCYFLLCAFLVCGAHSGPINAPREEKHS